MSDIQEIWNSIKKPTIQSIEKRTSPDLGADLARVAKNRQYILIAWSPEDIEKMKIHSSLTDLEAVGLILTGVGMHVSKYDLTS